jgi:hypothetical protein
VLPDYEPGGELVLPPGAPAWLETVIRTGDRDPPVYHTDGHSKTSDAIWAVINETRRLGWDDTSIIALITDPQWKISENCLRHGDPQAEAQRQINHARAKDPNADLDKQGPVPLGYTENPLSFVLLLPEKQVVVMLSPSKLSHHYEQAALAPYHYWARLYPDEDGKYSATRTMTGIMAECTAAGPYDPTKVRGRGVWREGARIIINLDRSEKTSTEGYIYPCFRPIGLDAAASFETAAQADPDLSLAQQARRLSRAGVECDGADLRGPGVAAASVGMGADPDRQIDAV